MSIDSLFQAIQEDCLPGIWSKGVALSREKAVLAEGPLTPAGKTDELKFRIRLPNRPISPRVTLWPDDEDSYCDCGEKVEPCAHIAAAIIALKGGLIVSADSGEPGTSSANAATLVYRFTRREDALHLDRYVVRSGAGEERLAGSLVSLIGGITSGRVSTPPVPATQGDFAADAALSNGTRGETHTGRLPAPILARLLKALEDCAAITLDGTAVRASGRMAGVRARLTDESAGFRLRIAQDPAITEVFANGAALCGDTLRPLTVPSLTEEERTLFTSEGRLFGPREAPYLATTLLPSLETKIPLEMESRKLPRVVTAPPRIVLKSETLGADLVITPILLYGDPPLARVIAGQLELSGARDAVPARDPAAEHALTRRLQSELNLRPDQPARFSGEAAVRFRMSLKDWELAGPAEASFGVRAPLEARITARGNAFELSFESGPGGAPGRDGASRVSAEQVFRAWRENASYVPLTGGGWAPLPRDWLARFGPRIERLLAARDARGELPPFLRPELARFCEDTGTEPPETFTRLRRTLETFDGLPRAALPADLRADLRDYQRRGIDWLHFLRGAGLGALLADDMGLGKTLQALCAVRGRTLVVMPTSVLSSWAEQIARFRPGLRVARYYGSERALDPRADVTLTTYAVLRIDQDRLAGESWDTAILDEAQTIRNPDSQVSRAAHRLRAEFRLCLSGTPVENRLDDLWSQFQFLNPGLLGERGSFQDELAAPIARGDADAGRELRARIKPFILRRLKREVAPELPPRTETLLHCELSGEERTLYDAILSTTRTEVLAQLAEGKGGIMAALEALLRLRQASCHPALVPGQSAATSSKLDLLLETLDESVSEGHRSLVFSQWTSLLDLIEPQLRAHGISFARLDGSTPNRSEIVSRFQAPGGPSVLLLSLKAGGVGLTLTAADHVFLMDPWWNPAAEDQAADRAHRIGQENPVLIHRLVARDTVEERILALQKQKQELAAAVLSDTVGALGLTRDDLLSLLT